MITQINPNIQFDYYELNNYINNILVYLVNKSFTMNTKILLTYDDPDCKYFLRHLVLTEAMTPSRDIRFKIHHHLIDSFKQAHNDYQS